MRNYHSCCANTACSPALFSLHISFPFPSHISICSHSQFSPFSSQVSLPNFTHFPHPFQLTFLTPSHSFPIVFLPSHFSQFFSHISCLLCPHVSLLFSVTFLKVFSSRFSLFPSYFPPFSSHISSTFPFTFIVLSSHVPSSFSLTFSALFSTLIFSISLPSGFSLFPPQDLHNVPLIFSDGFSLFASKVSHSLPLTFPSISLPLFLTLSHSCFSEFSHPISCPFIL